jgi:hypothetical protein
MSCFLKNGLIPVLSWPGIFAIWISYRGSDLNRFFLSNMEWAIRKYKPKLWVHGHTHSSMDYVLGETRILCNPYGYHHEKNPEYQKDLVIELC